MNQRVHRALLSVSDKSGLEGFARQLAQLGIELISTGGTYRALRSAGIPVTEVAQHTGSPEMMDGRVKTLHPKIHGGILALRDNREHVAAMREHGISGIDLVVVNLYPFEATVATPGVSREDTIEQIDIGGPSMVRSAAKNHRFVAIVTDPGDYGRVLDELTKLQGALSDELRRDLAQRAYALTARYDAAIAAWLWEQDRPRGAEASRFPESFALAGKKAFDLRYGENPHQGAAFYRTPLGEPCAAHAEVLNGKSLSFNNLVDIDAAHALAKEFDEPFVCVIKHTNACGAAAADTIALALERAWSGDPISAFGSVLAFTRPLDLDAATFLVDGNRFVEAIIAPSFDEDAYELLTKKPRWGKSVRLLACGPYGPGSRDTRDLEVKKLVGGFLLQDRDLSVEVEGSFEVVTKTKPTAAQAAELAFANRIAKHVKSNAIVLTHARTVVGVGAGQMSRVDSVRLAAHKAGDRATGSVLASDAFFPFPDGVEAAIGAGVAALVQPGGSVRDADVVAACDARGSRYPAGRRRWKITGTCLLLQSEYHREGGAPEVGAPPLLQNKKRLLMRLPFLRVLVPTSLALLLTAAASAQAWSDNFESYAPGSALEGQGGWEGWGGVNTAFTVVSSSFANSGTRSIQPNPGSDTVYVFTPPTSGTWVFVGQIYIPTGFASQFDYMVMNKYTHAGPHEWGSWIVFDGAAGTVSCNCGGFGASVVGMPYDRWVEVRQEIDLDNNVATIYFDGAQFASYIWTDGYSGTTNHQVGSIEAIDLYATMTGSGLYIDDLELYQLASTIGTSYCGPAVPNSTGASSTIDATGLTQVANNDVTLNAANMPNNAFGYFLTSRTQGFVPTPGGSVGNLCLGGSIGRYVGPGQIQNSGTTGAFSLQIDLNQTPTPTGFVAVAAGETWNFTTWHRDAVGGVATSNFTNGISIVFN